MTITHWPVSERPREKLLAQGPDALSDAELLAIFLRTGLPGQSAVDLGRQLLNDFGNLRALMNASEADFCARRGLGQATYAQLQATLELSRRHLWESLQEQPTLNSPALTQRYLREQLRGRCHEVFACIFLNTRHQAIAFEELFQGTIDGASVHPRVVVKQALHHNAAAVIFAHNHPSGIAEPSQSDRAITDRLKAGLELVDIRVLDHVVIGDAEAVSFAERGWI